LEFAEIMAARRSTRSFTPAIPAREQIEQIIRAGLLGPHATYAADQNGICRRFSVVMQGNPLMAQIDALIMRRTAVLLAHLKEQMESNAVLRQQGQAHLQRMEMISQRGLLISGGVPCYIVIAEIRGFPPVQQETLAHCLENMWLQATALGLGLRLLSITAEMAADAEFCQLLDLPFGKFGINGCAVGYPTRPPEPVQPPEVDTVTHWF
jgi:nitroreductase